ncbi:helix-turn-helix transcriptional regulator [Haliea sp. E1-2-M8]|uniref:helix-turn-helix domain-containing protein n=1 Tax=Haliea sp. E1-2-M8 TaxID=3064706 RepID=UPI00271E4E57|nr:helix-turn-helix transcriptional regulator [Haliea sp. E1-2-M8]MDO8862123.1 helix-turn-helix transcriptional regulator [Haliea sp. E1-2-M8]
MGSKEVFAETPARVSPGAMLQAAREARGLTALNVAERLFWLPEYVAFIERDEFERLRRPAFARGYVRAYARMLGLDEALVLAGFDEVRPLPAVPSARARSARPLPLQRTGVGIIFGLGVLALLVLGLWWAQSGQAVAGPVYGG